MDPVTKEKRSEIMSKIRSTNTGPERKMAVALKQAGIKFVQWAQLPGKPDFYMADLRLVVSVMGCFWHGCPQHGSSPKTNVKFWRDKIHNNKKRDRRVARQLRNMGFLVLRFWEHEVNADVYKCLREVANALESRGELCLKP